MHIALNHGESITVCENESDSPVLPGIRVLVEEGRITVFAGITSAEGGEVVYRYDAQEERAKQNEAAWQRMVDERFSHARSAMHEVRHFMKYATVAEMGAFETEDRVFNEKVKAALLAKSRLKKDAASRSHWQAHIYGSGFLSWRNGHWGLSVNRYGHPMVRISRHLSEEIGMPVVSERMPSDSLEYIDDWAREAWAKMWADDWISKNGQD